MKLPKGFTVLEVLVAMSILVVTLIAIYQSFSTSLFILNSTQNLWRAITGSQNELLRWERSFSAPVSLAQGEIADEEDPLLFIGGEEGLREDLELEGDFAGIGKIFGFLTLLNEDFLEVLIGLIKDEIKLF